MELILNLDWLKVMYIVGAIAALTIAIIMYPTLKYGPKDDSEEHVSNKSSKQKLAKSR